MGSDPFEEEKEDEEEGEEEEEEGVARAPRLMFVVEAEDRFSTDAFALTEMKSSMEAGDME